VRFLGVALAMLALVPGASAAPGKAAFAVTLGSTDGAPNGNLCAAGIACTYVPSVGALAPSLVVPFTATVTSFSVNSGSAAGRVALRVLRGDGGTLLGVRSSARFALHQGLNTFKVVVPVAKGDVLALDNDSSALIFAHAVGDPLDVTAYFQPALANGRTDQPNHVVSDQRLLLSATVESTPPVIRSLTQSAAVWRESPYVRRRVPIGTTFSFTVNQSVTGSLVFTRGASGIGKLPLTAPAGRHVLRFTGQLASGRLLKPGRYTVRLSVENDAGDAVQSVPLSFRVLG
jgi:hypothetical protein